MTDIALYGSISYDIDDKTSLSIIASNDVKKVFVWWSYNKKENIARVRYCKKLNLNIHMAHLEFLDINDFWQEGKKGDKLLKTFQKHIKQISKYNIPIAILHATKGQNPPPKSLIGIKRFQALANYAQKFNIILAIENSRKPDYFDYIFDNIKNDNLQVCYDSGHDHAFTSDTFNFEKYKGKFACLHIHDNDGKKDRHMIPFDGNIDWDNVLAKIKNTGYNGPIILEVAMGDEKYKKVSGENFVKKAVKNAKKLAKMYDKM